MLTINEPPVYCRIVDVKRDEYGRRGHTLQGWRARNRLYMRAEDGNIYPVPMGAGPAT